MQMCLPEQASALLALPSATGRGQRSPWTACPLARFGRGVATVETLTFTFSCQTLQRLIEPPDVSVPNGSGGAAGPDGLEGSSDFEEWKRGFLSA